MSKRVWKIPVEWAVCDIVAIEANTLEEAMEIFEQEKNEISLGTDPQYIDGSYNMSGSDEYHGDDLTNYISEVYNQGKK